MMRQPAVLEELAVLEARQEPLAGGDRRARCRAAAAPSPSAFSNGNRLLEPAGPERPQCVVEQHRGARRQELAALDEDLAVAVPGPRARPRSARRRARISPASSSRRPSYENGRHLNAWKPRRTASARRRKLPRASARPAASGSRSRAGACGRRRPAGARRARRAACPRGPTTRCRARTARSRTRRRRASATRGRGGASAARAPPDPAPTRCGAYSRMAVSTDSMAPCSDASPQPDEAFVGRDAHEQPVAPVDPVLERVDAGDLHDGRTSVRLRATELALDRRRRY